MGVNQLFKLIDSGKEGKNIGISTGSKKIDSVTYGIQKRYLYTIGADTSGGKTSFALDVFVYNFLINSKDTPISILYYSFEMSSEVLYAKLLSRYIWDEFNVVITYEDILSLTSPISDENFKIVQEARKWLSEISKSFFIYDKALSPNGIYATCKEWLKNFGEFNQISEHKEEYIDNDPERYKVVLIDHVALISGPGSKKEKIDLVADYMIGFRNKCNITGIFIQQMNRNSKSMERKTSGYELYQLDDFKDTSGTTDASEVVIALYYPFREKIARCEGYPIQNVLKKKFRLFQLLKNRYGQSDVNIGLSFYGEIGMFKELPLPEEISNYEPYLNLTNIKKDNELNVDDELNVDENEYEFKM